jgi:hypothetical protein
MHVRRIHADVRTARRSGTGSGLRLSSEMPSHPRMTDHAAHHPHHRPWLSYVSLATSMSLVGSYVGLSKWLVAVLPIFLLAWLRFGIAAVAMAGRASRCPVVVVGGGGGAYGWLIRPITPATFSLDPYLELTVALDRRQT